LACTRETSLALVPSRVTPDLCTSCGTNSSAKFLMIDWYVETDAAWSSMPVVTLANRSSSEIMVDGGVAPMVESAVTPCSRRTRAALCWPGGWVAIEVTWCRRAGERGMKDCVKAAITPDNMTRSPANF